MGRIAGNSVIALGIVLIVMTFLWVAVEIAEFPNNPNEDQRGEAAAGLLFAAVLILFGVALCLTGRSLRHPSAVARVEEVKQPAGRLRPWPLALYLTGSIAIALFATCIYAFIHVVPESLRWLWLLVGQPFVFAEIFLRGIVGLRFESDVARQVVATGVTLVYYPVLLYPLYRILTMDRTAEPAGYRRMKTLLILFAGVHILIGMAFSILIKA